MNVFDPTLARKITGCGNIAVVVLEDPAKAVKLAQCLHDGGVTVMELTLRTPAAIEAIRVIAAEVPGMIVGAGTVLTPQQLKQSHDAGAAFAVAPGFNARIVAAAKELNFSFAPGVMTPSEIEGALETGCRLLKFFPAGVIGGLKAIKTLVAPYNHLNVKYIPLGGLTPETTAEYLACPLIAACGGSWIAPGKLINAGDWKAIRENAAKATEISKSARALIMK